MRSSAITFRSRRDIKLVPLELRSGESLSSTIDHQAQLWGVTRRDLMMEVSFMDAIISANDPDVCRGDGFLDIYAAAAGLSPERFHLARALRREVLISPRFRHAYCPICVLHDLARGEAPCFRLDWARVTLTHCTVHRCPLFRWQDFMRDGVRRIPHSWLMGIDPRGLALPGFRNDLERAMKYVQGEYPTTGRGRTTWNALLEFESHLYREGVGDPRSLCRGRVALALEGKLVKLAVAFVRPVGGDTARSIVNMVDPQFEDASILRFTLRNYRGRQSSPGWRDLSVSLNSPPCRRAVLLMVAHTLGYADGALVCGDGTVAPAGLSPEWRAHLAGLSVGEPWLTSILKYI